jgi:hypothetical protein
MIHCKLLVKTKNFILILISIFRIKVLRLNPSTIAELHSYTKPPDEVLTVMRATFLLLGHSEKELHVILSLKMCVS